jgi:epoxide hydrolase-like predicted phosphatase
MIFRAIYFDLGGVIVRTEFQAPRQHLAERFGMDYDGLSKLVFDGETARQASLGVITEDEHWAAIVRKLHLPESELPAIRTEFFAGDITDLQLVNTLRDLRKHYKVGLISNAWSGLRPWIVRKKFDDAFDSMTISAEAGILKPDPRIYQLALDGLGVCPAESIFLDDFPENVQAAHACGMTAIHFDQPERALDELHQILADQE